MEQPENLKLLRSIAVALPLSPDPVEALAAGFRVPKSAMVDRLKGLMADGIVLGVWGEPNPALQGGDSTIGAPGATGRVRWSGRLEGGEAIEAVVNMAAGTNNANFLKAGTPPIIEQGVEALLGADQDRTCLVEMFPTPWEPLNDVEERLVRALVRPLAFDPAEGLWEQVGAAAKAGAGESVMQIRRLVIRRYWRRIAMKVNLGRAGWNGCGLARWTMDPMTAREAGAALAALRCTGDVLVLPESKGNLVALFMAMQADEGRRAAEAVSRQWGIAMERWESVMLE